MPVTTETATQKPRMAEDGWNTRAPARVALACTPEHRWRNRRDDHPGLMEPRL